eukprot:1786243-Alexandrium_andersonii.AAC.1
MLRGVIRDWHFGPPCLSWGTLRRPRVRSKDPSWGLGPSGEFTAPHNRIALRTARLCGLAQMCGLWASNEQPGSSVTRR